MAPADNELCAAHLEQERTQTLLTALREFTAASTPPGHSPPAPDPSAPTEALPRLPSPPSAPRSATEAAEETASTARRRAVAVLGTFGILAGVGGWASTTAVAHSISDGHFLGAVQPDDTSTEWARQARAELSLTDKQLTLIALTQARWNHDPRAATLGTPPAPVSELIAHRAILERRQAELRTQLAPYDTASRLHSELAQQDQRIADLNRQLTTIPVNSPDPTQRAARADLDRQLRDSTAQRQTDQRAFDQLATSLDSSHPAPLPADSVNRTTTLVNNVLSYARTPSANPPRSTAVSPTSSSYPTKPSVTGSTTATPPPTPPPTPSPADPGYPITPASPQSSSDDDHSTNQGSAKRSTSEQGSDTTKSSTKTSTETSTKTSTKSSSHRSSQSKDKHSHHKHDKHKKHSSSKHSHHGGHSGSTHHSASRD